MRAQQVREYLEQEHEAIEQRLNDFVDRRRDSRAAERIYFEAFNATLRWHMEWEEEVLFPLFELKTGDRLLTRGLRAEHGQIRWCLQLLQRQLDQAGGVAETNEAALLTTLADHSRREHETLYPALERLINEEEADAAMAARRGQDSLATR